MRTAQNFIFITRLTPLMRIVDFKFLYYTFKQNAEREKYFDILVQDVQQKCRKPFCAFRISYDD